MVPNLDGKLLRVRYRSHATSSRQPRQVRKEATVTGSYVCSGFPVPGFFIFFAFDLHIRFKPVGYHVGLILPASCEPLRPLRSKAFR